MAQFDTGGRTRWGRFAGTLGAGLAGAAVLVFGMAQGAVAASFAVSGVSFKVSADKLVGDGFVQLVGVDQGSGAAHPVAVSGFRGAVLDNFCQSVLLRSVPVVGDITLVMVSAGPGGMAATDLVIGVAGLSGDLTLVNPQLGVDAARLDRGPVKGAAGSFGLQADRATIVGLRQTSWSTSAQTIRLKNIDLSLRKGDQGCF
ncbi:DUF6230 family protein [Actinokineospora spheciospongiae]|uniref:DUF6230 family protein n=1 Tax=Actinokineospora spheciospongiae TaxID=909613 RepID=UPI0005577FF4|nr:DUF6230 family protein [Actinokineospora spheciospongiae]